MPDTSLTKVGRYEIRRELGRGTMGIVYLAEDPALQRPVALKTIDISFQIPAAERAGFEERFGVEARVAGRLSHPGIVVVHDVGRDADSGVLYMALEYLEGQTLADLAATGEFPPWRETLAIVAKLARALHHAHANGVVHRDVKPANVMLLQTGEPKIMDFGIAKSPHIELTSAGQLFGTPLYMSPEQALGQPVDGRSDLFSLGSIAYMLLAGRQAFGAENVFQVLARVAQEQPTPATELRPELPPEVDVFLARALAKAPAARYQDGQAMARDAEALVEGRPLAPAPVDDRDSPLLVLVADQEVPHLTETRALPPPTPGAPRRAFPSGLLVAAIALLVVAAVIFVIWPGRPGPERAAATDLAAAGAAPVAPPVEKATPAPPLAAGRLAIDFEHHLKSGLLRVFVDGDTVLEEELDARRTKKVLLFKVSQGAVRETIDVAAGKHTVRVQVKWDEHVRQQSVAGTFRDGVTRRLRVRVGRLLGDLSVRLE
ncbi:MAG: serine/threonine-protein kinase [Vicinamibacteria bacterium]